VENRKLDPKGVPKNKQEKTDLSNKLVHELLQWETVAIQDENLSGWKASGHGKSMQNSILGRVKAKLKDHNRVEVVGRFEATTKTCSQCGTVKKMTLSDRRYRCGVCSLDLDRDLNAALNMVKLAKAKQKVGVGRTKVKPVDSSSELDEVGRSLPLGSD